MTCGVKQHFTGTTAGRLRLMYKEDNNAMGITIHNTDRTLDEAKHSRKWDHYEIFAQQTMIRIQRFFDRFSPQ